MQKLSVTTQEQRQDQWGIPLLVYDAMIYNNQNTSHSFCRFVTLEEFLSNCELTWPRLADILTYNLGERISYRSPQFFWTCGETFLPETARFLHAILPERLDVLVNDWATILERFPIKTWCTWLLKALGQNVQLPFGASGELREARNSLAESLQTWCGDMDFGFTFFEASVLVPHTADLLEKTIYFRIIFDFTRMNVSTSQSLHFGYLPGAVEICIQCQCCQCQGKGETAGTYLLLVLSCCLQWMILILERLEALYWYPKASQLFHRFQTWKVPRFHPKCMASRQGIQGSRIFTEEISPSNVYPCISWTPLLLVLSSHESRATDGCFDGTKLHTIPRIACALHSLARDGHWYPPVICVLKKIVWSCLVIQFCTFLDMKSGGRKGLECTGLAKHPQGLQRLRVIYHCSGVLQSVEVAVKESDELRRMAGCRISPCWNQKYFKSL